MEQVQARPTQPLKQDINVTRLNYGYEYEATVGLGNHVGGGPHLYGGFRVEPSQPNLHGVGYGFHELRLA
ncbi:hypothetical protein Taro_047050 [Colocasia esculenta]|uniref:Uncharacterized protein n=1 Tax=Colocasia esculenta TaxID=4460 RepID=A0A843WV89_COLES|nr:hypothetical protein [Colocasia esculenta]